MNLFKLKDPHPKGVGRQSESA